MKNNIKNFKSYGKNKSFDLNRKILRKYVKVVKNSNDYDEEKVNHNSLLSYLIIIHNFLQLTDGGMVS